MAAQFDHCGINVPDMAAAVAFFTEAFGATVVFAIDRFADPSGESMRRIGAPGNRSLAITMLAIGDGRVELLSWGVAEVSGQAEAAVAAADITGIGPAAASGTDPVDAATDGSTTAILTAESIAAHDSSVPLGAHLSIEVDDVASTLAALAAINGVAVLSAPLTFTDGETPGLTNAFIRAPWGTLIELVSW